MANNKTNNKKTKLDYIYTVGRRKSASARVRLYTGKGESTVNGKPITDYFPGAVNKDLWSKPFKTADVSDKYHISAKVAGGGKNGQLDAVVHGIARALAKAKSDEFRAPLKKAGLLTRDPRIRERRKVGTGGRARRQKQSPKR
jgi:small subunit ribosomal protein S9